MRVSNFQGVMPIALGKEVLLTLITYIDLYGVFTYLDGPSSPSCYGARKPR